MISSYFWGCPRSMEFIQSTIILTVFFWENKQTKQLSKSLGSLIFSKTLKPSVHTLKVFRVPKMQVHGNGPQSIMVPPIYPFGVDGRKRRFSKTMMSYIIQRMPCMVCFRFSIVLSILFGRAKMIFRKRKKCPFSKISGYVWTKPNLKTEENAYAGGKEVNKMCYGQYENGE